MYLNLNTFSIITFSLKKMQIKFNYLLGDINLLEVSTV